MGDEVKVIVKALASFEDSQATQDEIMAAIWLEQSICTEETLLQMLRSHKLTAMWPDGAEEPLFKNVNPAS